MKHLARLTSPKWAGVIGMVGTGMFMLGVFVLGFITPGYSHLKNTVSALAVGKYGDFYSLLLVILAGTTALAGLAIGRHIHGKNINATSLIFWLFSLGLVMVMFIKMDPRLDHHIAEFDGASFSGKLHFLITGAFLMASPIIIARLANNMKIHSCWQPLSGYTIKVLIVNYSLGILWFVLFALGWGDGWKGLLQKIIIYNGLVWYFRLSYRLMRLKHAH